jgi:outer membrane immunogenic protein
MSVRGRVGYATDAMLYYFTAGGAWGHTSYSANTVDTVGNGAAFPIAFTHTAQGYVLGGGVEYALNTNWSIRAEYLYYRLSGASQSTAFFPAFGMTNYTWSAFEANVLRTGVDYKF